MQRDIVTEQSSFVGRLPRVALRPHDHPGVLVAVDGSDGTGKTTLLGGLERELRSRGHDVLTTRQPTTEARESSAFRDFLFRPDLRDDIDYRALLCLMIGDRLQHLHRVVRPALARGAVVLCDRYIFTQMVTTVTRGFDDELWMLELYKHVLRPDVGVITAAPPSVVIERISSRSDARESLYEDDHVRSNLRAYSEVADHYDLTVIDTLEVSADEAVARVLADIEQQIAHESGTSQGRGAGRQTGWQTAGRAGLS